MATNWLLLLQQAGLPAISAVEEIIDGAVRVNVSYSRGLTQAEVLTQLAITDIAEYRKMKSRVNAKAIPDWSIQDEAWILDWLNTNIGLPLATPIPANPMTVQQIRATLVNIVAVMNKMYNAQKAQARMIVAIRDDVWPDL